MKKSIYISGKIGELKISEATREKFAKVEKMLYDTGYDVVINPANNEAQSFIMREAMETMRTIPELKGKLYECMLLSDIMLLAVCDDIYMLPDFLESKWAKAEHALAIALGKTIIYDEELYENGTLRR